MTQLLIRPGDKFISNYYEVLGQFGQLSIDHEMAVRSAFQSVLTACARKLSWTLVPEWPIKPAAKTTLRVDGALLDESRLVRGLWEAKDDRDNLEKEVRKKLNLGYPGRNILFQQPTEAILVQRGQIKRKEDISQRDALVDVLKDLFEYRDPHIIDWEDAVSRFKQEVPEQARALKDLIDREHKKNAAFRDAFGAFVETCKASLNPQISEEAVERMLIQHILTERIFSRVFRNEDFRSRNVVAAELEKVVEALIKGSFNRHEFLRSLDPFYKAIENSAEETNSFEEKQTFLNTVYERFFQGFSPKEADTHGIVYTPQPIVDFMVRSVDDILQNEFGKSLADKGVHILDPFVGTGNFIVRVMKQIAQHSKRALAWKYEHELHCNEVMLLPYYIASMNIEHEYLEQMQEYKPFEGICLVDTFELAEPEQSTLSFMTEENTARVKRQKEAPIFVVVGNPPYNAGQKEEGDNNKNRKYRYIDGRITATYAKRSAATLLRKLQDPYVKAIIWATERIGNDGVVAFVTNSSFVHEHSLDGMRACLEEEFESIYIVDLLGNVYKNPKIAGTTHNVFGIKNGVCITFFVRRNHASTKPIDLFYTSATDEWRKERKLTFLEDTKSFSRCRWTQLYPDRKHSWLNAGMKSEFDDFLASDGKRNPQGIFEDYCLGISTNRDEYVYGFQADLVKGSAERFAERYNTEVARFIATGRPKKIDEFVRPDAVKWSRNLKRHLSNCDQFFPKDADVVKVHYRPFTAEFIYLSDVIVDEPSRTGDFFRGSNKVIALTGPGSDKPFVCLVSEKPVDAHFVGSGCTTQAFPFYLYDEDGSNRRENITDWALNEFRTHYNDRSITKWEIFYFVYTLLHHPEYRERYAANLKRELPRIPYAPDFRAFAKSGEQLADLHINYEKQPEYKLKEIENPEEKPTWRVERMRLSKDKSTLFYNDFLTLEGIPPETYEYRLGNRSALEWVIDQYQVSTDKRSGITNDPNREDDPQYILRLIGQVIHVSLETMKIVKALPTLLLEKNAQAANKSS